jgi:hypothetical protein
MWIDGKAYQTHEILRNNPNRPREEEKQRSSKSPTGLETALQQIQQEYKKVVVLDGLMIDHDDGCKKKKLFSR